MWCARHLVGDEPFAVLLVDDLMVGETPCLKQMVDAYQEIGGNIVAVIEVPRDQTRRYGVLDVGRRRRDAWCRRRAWSKSPTPRSRRRP